LCIPYLTKLYSFNLGVLFFCVVQE
jgi:hypothetical protein